MSSVGLDRGARPLRGEQEATTARTTTNAHTPPAKEGWNPNRLWERSTGRTGMPLADLDTGANDSVEQRECTVEVRVTLGDDRGLLTPSHASTGILTVA